MTQDFPSNPYFDALNRYQGYRDAAYDLTWRDLHTQVPAECDLRLWPIDDKALTYWQAIKAVGALDPRGSFPWDEIYRQVRSCPRRFDIAIWDGLNLCGMACGMASRGPSFVTVKWIERFATDTGGLRGMVAETALTAAEHYAFVLQRQHVRVKNPLPGTEHLYENLGFTTDVVLKGNHYLQRDVGMA